MVIYVYMNKTVNSVDFKDCKYTIFPAPDASRVNENQHFNLQLSNNSKNSNELLFVIFFMNCVYNFFLYIN